MKPTISLTLLSVLLIFGAANIVIALPQQQPGAVPVEKKRAMNKFDPTDFFPEAKEHGRKERTKRDKNSASLSILAGNTSLSGAEHTSASRKNSRRHRSETTESSKPATRLTANALPSPTPAQTLAGNAPSPSPSLVAIQRIEPTPATAPQDSPAPSIVMGGAAALTTPSSPTLIASNNARAPSSETASPGRPQSSWLSLPVILTLLSLVTVALILALAKLRKQLRGSVN